MADHARSRVCRQGSPSSFPFRAGAEMEMYHTPRRDLRGRKTSGGGGRRLEGECGDLVFPFLFCLDSRDGCATVWLGDDIEMRRTCFNFMISSNCLSVYCSALGADARSVGRYISSHQATLPFVRWQCCAWSCQSSLCHKCLKPNTKH